MSSVASTLRSLPVRTKTGRGKSGTYLVGAGLVFLTLGMVTDALDWTVEAGGLSLSVLEVGIVCVLLAVALAFVRYLLGKLKRAVGIGILGAVGVGFGLPSVLAVPAVGGFAKRVVTSVYGTMPWVETTPWGRAIAAVGGPKGLVSGCYGATLLTVGASTGSLDDEYVVFGHELTLLAVFVFLSIPGVVIYYVRR